MKKIAALVMAFAVAVTTVIPVFATRYSASGEYTYRNTEALEADIVKTSRDEKIVLTWPAVDTEGNLINNNPLTSTSAYGDPMGSWTMVKSGMIICYGGWLADGTHTSDPTKTNGTNYNVIRGLTKDTTDTTYPVVLYGYDENYKSYLLGETAYIDTTVVANSIATAYKIQYSEDGVTWTDDHNVTTIDHGKKLYRPADNENGYTSDAKNTWFLEDQFCETLDMQNSLTADTEYKIRVLAYNATDINSVTTDTAYKVFETTVTTPKEKKYANAFPTVEGGGTSSIGGRDGDVYVVTNLTDSVTDPQPGSLRYGLLRKDRTDGDSEYPRIIVFAVGGTIEVDSSASKSERRINVKSNTTILGQTAPGDGITLSGMSLKFDGENIICRYLRTRLGAGYDQDAATASGKNIVIDHCTFEWGTDETFTAKELINSSIQYNIIAGGLAMVNKNGDNNTDAELVSAESEAKHGMGSLLNGSETSVTHNLWAHNGTRNPRFEGAFEYNGTTYNNTLEFSNNVVYNWGHNSAYGGDRGEAQVNYTNNYFKPGPNTLEKVKTYLFDCDTDSSYGNVKSSYYISGNIMEGSDEVTNDNTKGFKDLSTCANQLTDPVTLTNEYTAETADKAYENVLENVGASYKRDAQDIRLINDVKTGGGRFINDPSEAGGYETDVYTSSETDTDNDGIPDLWEIANGLDSSTADSYEIVENESSPYYGYSWIEAYASDIIGEWDSEGIKNIEVGDDVEVTSITDENGTDVMDMAASKLEVGKTYTVNISSSNAVSYEVYLNDDVIAEGTEKAIKITPEAEGIFNLAVKAKYNIDGVESKAFSELIPVISVANKDENLEGYTAEDIGSPKASGVVSYDAADGTMLLGGAGKIGITSATGTNEADSFFYNYKAVTGDLTITAKVNPLAKLDYYQKAGVMVRSSLDSYDEFYMAGVTFVKGEDYEGQTDASGSTVKAKNVRSFARTAKGNAVSNGNFVGVALKRLSEEPNYGWVKLVKKDQTVTTYGSVDGSSWTELNTYETTLPETFYVGFAIDAVQDTHELVRYNAAEFSNIAFKASAESDEEIAYGDANGDGMYTAIDAAHILKKAKDDNYILPVEELYADIDVKKYFDLNGDDTINADDVALALNKARNSDYVFPVLA